MVRWFLSKPPGRDSGERDIHPANGLIFSIHFPRGTVRLSPGTCCSDRGGDPCSSISDVKSSWLVSLGLGSSSPSLQSERLAQYLPAFHISKVWNLSDGQQCGPGSVQLGAPGGPHSEAAGHQEG